MRIPSCLLSAAAVAVVLGPGAAAAHSLQDLQQELLDDEKYFQVKNEPAPDFALQDAEGNPVRLQDLRGKAVVLHFVYAGCPDVCPLHAERIAQIQETVNATPRRNRWGSSPSPPTRSATPPTSCGAMARRTALTGRTGLS